MSKAYNININVPRLRGCANFYVYDTEAIIISAKWTKWTAEIMRSLDVSVCVCALRSGRSWELNANSSKTVKATDFKFDTSLPRDSPDMTPKNLSKWGRD